MINYLVIKHDLIDTLSALNAKVSLTSDIWTASVGSMYFISITTHYIVDDWQLNKHILACRSFDYPHSG